MNFDLLLNGAFLASFTLFTGVFLLQRLRYRRKKTANPNHRGFYPTAAALSLALISLHTLAQPDLNHALEQRQTAAPVLAKAGTAGATVDEPVQESASAADAASARPYP